MRQGKLNLPQETVENWEYTQQKQVRELQSQPIVDSSNRDYKIRTAGNAGIRQGV